jgi:hypothetical protein
MRRVCVKSASELAVDFSPARLGLYDNSTEREGLFMRRLVLTFVIATAIVGCNRNTKLTRANFDKIQPGMTVAEVETLLGPGEQEGGDLSIAEGSGVAGAAGVGGDLQSMGGARSTLKTYKWGNDKRWIKVTFQQGKVAPANAKQEQGLN